MDVDTMQITRALSEHPELFLQEGARRNLLWFAEYMDSNFQPTPFHRAYYRVLDMFAKRRIKKLIVQAPPQHGKALSVETPVLTTKGWKRHGDLCQGDYVFGEDGKPRRVKWNSGVYKCESQSVNFADGFSIIAARQHEWVVYADHDDHKGRVREIVETQNLFSRRNRRNPYIPANAIIDMPEKELPIDPYLLGVWLGDGNKRDKWVCCGNEDIECYRQLIIEQKPTSTANMIHLRGLGTRDLRGLNLLYNKHIPEQYLCASIEQRRELLRGLMDTDGCVDTRGTCEFCQKAGRLADDVYCLLRSLGYKPTRHKYVARLYGKDCGQKVRITFKPDKGEPIFKIPRKQYRLDNKTTGDRVDKKRFFIESVTDIGNTLVNCIEVEGGIYLAGYELVPTHNSQGSSRFLPADMLGHFPDLKICICSYAATIAKDFNRDVQRLIDSGKYRAIFPDTQLNGSNVVTVANNYLRNSDVFEIVNHAGSLRVVGRGGSLTSKTVDVMIYDDLYKDSAEANSPIIRTAAWEWFTKVAQTRLHNDSQQLVVFTRWNPDDIIGKIIESEKVIFVEKWSDLEDIPDGAWVLINFEAIKTGEPTEIDNRKPGQPLWPQRHSLERLLQQKQLDPLGFQCLYQGNPGDATAYLYQPFKTWVEKKDWGQYVRSGCYVDVADQGDDYLFAATYDIYKSENQIWNEAKRRMEPLLFALITDIEFTDESTEVTTVTVPRMINANGVQKAWIESNNGGSQFEKAVKKKVSALTVPFYQSENKESRIITNAPFVNQHIIMPFGWETRYKKFHDHVVGFLRKFDANEHDDGCFVAGTMIATPFGDRPIEEIKIGDYVITPIGYCRVMASAMTGTKEVINKCGLTGTPNHPVFQKKSFDGLAGISEDMVSLHCYKEQKKWKYKKLLFSMESNTALWGRESIICLNQTPILEENIRKDCMLRFGNFITEKKYRRAIVFIIKTGILLITTLATWNVYQFGNICRSMQERILKMLDIEKKTRKHWRKHKNLQSDGTEAQQGENGTKNTRWRLTTHRGIQMFVCNVVGNFCRAIGMQSFVAMNVGKNIAQEPCHTLVHADNAGKNLDTVKGSHQARNGNFVAGDAQQHIATHTAQVYNLTIEMAHCYYANGILVSNCDGLTGIYEKEIADGNTKPYGAANRGVRVR